MFKYHELNTYNYMNDILKVFDSDKISKVRLGKDNDGGYVIVDNLEYDVLISCGINDDDSFEHDFIKKYNTKCYAFDFSISNIPNPHSMISFKPLKVCNHNSESETDLNDLLSKYDNIFLKMDIEGSEFKWILHTSLEDLTKIKQIVIEFHEPGYNYNKKWAAIDKLNETHYLCHIHVNNIFNNKSMKNNIPKIFECTYISKQIIEDVYPNKNVFPTKLDMPTFVEFPDIRLSSYPYVSL